MILRMANQVVQIILRDLSFSVNPVNINRQTVLSVKVTEQTVSVEPEVLYSNEFRAGEVEVWQLQA